jgi:hypothetical protein
MSIHSVSPRSNFRLNYLNWLENYLLEEKVQNLGISLAVWQAFLPYRLSYIYSFFDSCKYLIKQILRILIKWQPQSGNLVKSKINSGKQR